MLICWLIGFIVIAQGSADRSASDDFLAYLMNRDGVEAEDNTVTGGCTFDLKRCLVTCELGFQTDPRGCVSSCRCKKRILFEGDVILTGGDAAMQGTERAVSRWKQRWDNIPQSDGTYLIPYRIQPRLAGNPQAKAAIHQAMDDFANATCLRFEPRTTQVDYLRFVGGQECSSYVGRIGGAQKVFLGEGCEYKDIAIHEMMHALGFWHEHSRSDRDKFVQIVFKNIEKDSLSNFWKRKKNLINSFGSQYDIKSVMQYDGFAFSANGKPTIINKKSRRPVEAQTERLSDEDIKQINRMHNC